MWPHYFLISHCFKPGLIRHTETLEKTKKQGSDIDYYHFNCLYWCVKMETIFQLQCLMNSKIKQDLANYGVNEDKFTGRVKLVIACFKASWSSIRSSFGAIMVYILHFFFLNMLQKGTLCMVYAANHVQTAQRRLQ